MKKKVAVCISGQSRTWRYCIDNIKSFFEKSNEYEIDYFIHTWDYNEYPSIYRIKNNKDLYFKFNDDIKEYIERYNPVNYIIQTNKSYQERLFKLYTNERKDASNVKEAQSKISEITDYNIIGMMYSFKQSILLKKIHERKNNFKYDYVVKIRPDVIFLHKSFSEHISILESADENSFISFFDFDELKDLNNTWGPDLYWVFKNSESADLFSSFFYKKLKFDLNLNNQRNSLIYGFNRHVYELNYTPLSIDKRKRNNYLIINRAYCIPFLNLNTNDLEIEKQYMCLKHFFEYKEFPFIELLNEYGLLEEFFNTNIISFFEKYPRLKKVINDILPSYIHIP